MNLDQAADQLYGGSPEDFVGRRKELAAEARRAGDRELVKQIGQLRRPTRSAWLVNLLARREPGRLQELLELGAALQDAQQRRSGNDLRRLSRERRTMIDALSRQAVEAGRELDYSPPDAAIQEVAQTLQAALGDPQVAELVRTGRLSQATTYGGFGPQDLTAALAASLPDSAEEAPSAETPAAHGSADPTGSEQEDAAEQRRRQEAERVAAEAEAVAAEARQAADDAETAAEEATSRADELADRIEEARRELRELEATERAAREDARAARRQHQELRQTAADAAQAATKARRQV